MSTSLLDNLFEALRPLGIGITDGTLEVLERKFLVDVLSNLQRPIVIDCGAHLGNYSKHVLEANPTAQIVCIEPNPISFAALKENLSGRVNNFLNYALSDKSGEALLFAPEDSVNSPLSSLFPDVISGLQNKNHKSFPVLITTIDDLVASANIPRIELLKIDAEGNELAILKGARNTIAQAKINFIQFEFNDMNAMSKTFFKDFFDLLSGQYKIYRMTEKGLLEISTYHPLVCEIFAIQNIVCIRTVQ